MDDGGDAGRGVRALLTPGGAAFARRVDKILAAQFAAVDNDGMREITEQITATHLRSRESVTALNQLAEARTKARSTAYYMIMNHANMLLCSGRFSPERGELDRTGCQLLALWRMYARHLVERGEFTQGRYDAEEEKLKARIASLGRSPGGFIRAVTSIFRKKK